MTELELDDILKRLCGSIPEISGVIVTGRTGNLIATLLPPNISVTLYSKLITLLYNENEKLGKICFGESEFDWFQICFGNEYFTSMSAGKNCLLTVYSSKDVRLGLINLDMKRTAEKIAQLEKLPSGLRIKWSEIKLYIEKQEIERQKRKEKQEIERQKRKEKQEIERPKRKEKQEIEREKLWKRLKEIRRGRGELEIERPKLWKILEKRQKR